MDSQYSGNLVGDDYSENSMETHAGDDSSITTEERNENSSEEEQSSITTENSSEEEIDPWSTLGTLRFYDAMIGDARPNLKNTGESNIICAAASGLKIFKFFVYLPTTRHLTDFNILRKYKSMCSFKKARDEDIVLAYDSSYIDDEEFVILHDIICCGKKPELPFKDYDSFSLAETDAVECKVNFRFKKAEIPVLARAMNIPEKFKCQQGTICDGIEGLCILLRRFCYPCRYSDLIPLFGRSVPEICMISNEVADFIYERHGEKITRWNHQLLNPHQLQQYVNAVHQKGAALDNCFGFVDGTVKAICRPGQMQRIVYNGHKRVHALKYQSLALPNGLIANLLDL